MINGTDVSIDDMVISIKALHVNKKQMTISVFNQLPEIQIKIEDIQNSTSKLWGYVTHNTKNWVVLSKDRVLYKSDSILGWVETEKTFRYMTEEIIKTLPQLFIAV